MVDTSKLVEYRVPLGRQPILEAMARNLTLAGVVAVAGLGALWLLEIGSRSDALSTAVFVAAGVVFLRWSFTRSGSGEVTICDGELILKAPTGTGRFELANILSADVTTLANAGPLWSWSSRLMGVRPDLPFLVVRFDRRIYVHPWRARFGTTEGGVPLLEKRIGIYVEDPNALLEAIRRTATAEFVN